MQIDLYNKEFSTYFASDQIRKQIDESVIMLSKAERIFFIGNGGSNAICSHMMEDYMKIARKKTFSFSDPALVSCFANDYGYENALQKWLEFNMEQTDILVAISSSGESKNILNACYYAKSKNASIITLSGFNSNNSLQRSGTINFVIPVSNYGIVECFHQTILHIILDSLNEK